MELSGFLTGSPLLPPARIRDDIKSGKYKPAGDYEASCTGAKTERGERGEETDVAGVGKWISGSPAEGVLGRVWD